VEGDKDGEEDGDGERDGDDEGRWSEGEIKIAEGIEIER
jgi:hypothetical protein